MWATMPLWQKEYCIKHRRDRRRGPIHRNGHTEILTEMSLWAIEHGDDELLDRLVGE